MKNKVRIYILISILLVCSCKSNYSNTTLSETPITYSDPIFKANENLFITYNSLHSKSKFENDTSLFLQLALYSINQSVQYKFSLNKDSDGLYKFKYKIPDSVFYIRVAFSSLSDEYKMEADENMVYKKVNEKYIPQKYALSLLATKPKVIKKQADVDSLINMSHAIHPNDASIYMPIIYLLYKNKDYNKILDIEQVMINKIKSFKQDMEQADYCNFLIALAYLKMLENEYEDCFYYLDKVLEKNYKYNVNYLLQIDFFLKNFDRKPGKIIVQTKEQMIVLNKLFKILANGNNFESLLNIVQYDYSGLDTQTSEILNSIYIIIADELIKGKRNKFLKYYSDSYPLTKVLENLISRKDFKRVDLFFDFAIKTMKERLVAKDSSHFVYWIETDNVCELYRMMSKFMFDLQENQKGVQYLNKIIDFTGNKPENYSGLKYVHISLFKYYNDIENVQLSSEHLKQAFLVELKYDKYDSLYLKTHNILRKKFKLNELSFSDFQDVERIKIMNNTFELSSQENKYLKAISYENTPAVIININDECVSCNTSLFDNREKLINSGLKLFIVSSLEKDKLKGIFSANFSVINRSKEIMSILNSSVESNVCGAIIAGKKKLLISNFDQNYSKLKDYLLNN